MKRVHAARGWMARMFDEWPSSSRYIAFVTTLALLFQIKETIH